MKKQRFDLRHFLWGGIMYLIKMFSICIAYNKDKKNLLVEKTTFRFKTVSVTRNNVAKTV